jgi:hypothetical protein
MISRGATDNSPALQRWVDCMFMGANPVRDERTLLPSIPGPTPHVRLNPSIETLGYSHCEVKEKTMS